MKNSLCFLVFVWVAVTNSLAQDGSMTIEFQVYSPDLPDTSHIYITGSLTELGFWNPAKAVMQNQGNHLWSKKISVKPSTSIEYKFTLGSWAREAADANGRVFSNFNALAKSDTTIKHNIFFWKSGEAKKAIVGQITGQVKYHNQVRGKNINPRDVVVWLPPDYDINKTKRYPVLYMHDGQNIFDPATSAFGIDWRLDESADSLIKKKSIPPVIIVGIYNSKDRTREYTPGEGGTAYMNFVVKKLKPMIDSAYRTKPDKNNTLVGGSSAGGLISFMLAWEYPSVFSKAICMSPAFKIMNIDYVKTVRASEKKNVFFYIDNGGIGLETQLQPGIDEMMKALKEKGYTEGKDYYYIVDLKARHFESDWAKRFPNALKICLEKK